MTPVQITYREPLGRTGKADLTLWPDDEEPPAKAPLVAERVRLADETADRTARQLRPGANAGPGGSGAAYELLDNEILAGVRLARTFPSSYPREVTRLIGFDADGAEPFALLEPLRGEPVADHAGMMLGGDGKKFQKSLLRAVLILNRAGIAHRGLSPDNVRWDGSAVQLTDFSIATLIGAPRTVVGAMPWQAPEQRARNVGGEVTGRDDVWAAGRLIYYMETGDDLDSMAQLDGHPLRELLHDVFVAPADRPTPEQLLRRLQAPAGVPAAASDPEFERGKAAFFELRARKHPHTVVRKPVEPVLAQAHAPAPAPPPPPPVPFFDLKSPQAWAVMAVGALIVLAVLAVIVLGG